MGFHDPSQVECYTNITTNMVGRVQFRRMKAPDPPEQDI